MVDFCGFHVGKFTSHMDPMGVFFVSTSHHGFYMSGMYVSVFSMHDTPARLLSNTSPQENSA